MNNLFIQYFNNYFLFYEKFHYDILKITQEQMKYE